MEIVTGTERRAALLLLAVLLISLPAANASAQPLDAQALCFDIISPRDAAELDGSILLDRCTGQTWLLSGVENAAVSSAIAGQCLQLRAAT